MMTEKEGELMAVQKKLMMTEKAMMMEKQMMMFKQKAMMMRRQKEKMLKKQKQPEITRLQPQGLSGNTSISGVRQDCRVTAWSPWSQQCSSTCGSGVRHRFRTVTQAAIGGGADCPTKLERRKRCRLPPCPKCVEVIIIIILIIIITIIITIIVFIIIIIRVPPCPKCVEVIVF